jgi:hypothetical protein
MKPDDRRSFYRRIGARAIPQPTMAVLCASQDANGPDDPPLEGWLCPALFRYFDQAPAQLYVRAEVKGG